jgi:CubicO group peptidase (beta-lactamase class C family)
MTRFSASGISRLDAALDAHVSGAEVPGLVALVFRGGEVHVHTAGVQAMGGPPMRRDTLFRISSMTKPITAAAAMTLVEESMLRLDEPVDRLLPELSDRRVLRAPDGALDDTVPASRPITVMDLLTFRLGFGILMAPPGSTPIQRADADLQLLSMGPPLPASPLPPDEWIRRFGTLPLLHQPGEKWMYNAGSLVLGVLLARASGKSLETLLEERIFEPLGMRDTSFSVPRDKLPRFASEYIRSPVTGALELYDGPGGHWSRAPAFPDAAAGLVSTADDYLAFARMLLDGGKSPRGRLLSEASVKAMTTDQLTADQKPGSEPILGGRGWGMGMAVATQPDDRGASTGRYGWDGGFGTSWANDPAQGLIGILMTQRMWDSPALPPVCRDFWKSASDAVAA